MSLWGPAAEAEIEYRQSELTKAWGGRRATREDRAGRTERGAGRRTERAARVGRTEQIREGIAGMRPASAARPGLVA